MESLSVYLQDYKEIVGSVASFVTIGHYLAGGFICKDIYKKGSTDGIPGTPFVGGVVIGLLMFQYSILLNDSAMLRANLTGISLSISYFLFYFFYSKTKGEVLKALGIGLTMIAVLVGYAKIENQDLIAYRFGIIVTILMLALIGSPMLGVKDVIRKKDASVIPFPIVLSGTIVSFSWLLYGIILLNDSMVFQHSIGLVLCAIQLTLCFMYPGQPDKKKNK